MDLAVVTVRIACSFHWLVCFRIADGIRLGQLKVITHSCNEGVGLLKNALHILEFNVVSGSIIINCRESFCCAAKIDWEWGQSRYFASTTLSMQWITIPVAVINGRPKTMFTLTWGPVATTNEVVLPSLVRYGR